MSCPGAALPCGRAQGAGAMVWRGALGEGAPAVEVVRAVAGWRECSLRTTTHCHLNTKAEFANVTALPPEAMS